MTTICNTTPPSKGPIVGARHLQTFLLFLAIAVNFACRYNISVSLVAMTDKNTTNPNFEEFKWNGNEKSYILSSFFWGYVISQIPGAYAARRFGVKNTIFFGTFLTSILGCSVPFCATWGGWQAFCAIRALQGLSGGVLFPCIYQHLAKWSPVEDRNLLGCLSHKGIECGNIVAVFCTGMIAASDLGWPGIFYVFSGVGVVFSFLWLLLGEDSPEKAKFITSAERNYILSSLKTVEDEIPKANSVKKKNIPVPWKAILTSSPFLSLLVVGLCQSWSFSTVETQMPSYLHGALKMNITQNAFYSALPYVGMLIFSFAFMIIADVLIKYKWMSLLNLRKIFNTIGMWGPAGFLTVIVNLNENQEGLAIACLTLIISVGCAVIIGNMMNLIDLSPNHTGVLMAFANTLASLVPVACPIVVGIIVTDETDRLQWRIVFLIAAGIFFLGNLQFLFFVQTDTQPWNDEDFMTKREVEQGMKINKKSSGS